MRFTSATILSQSIPEPNSGCWLWLRGKPKLIAKSYGRLQDGGVKQGAHRVSWLVFNGPIPDGLCVLHKCDTPSCVNPKHLLLGTLRDNSRDMVAKGRGRKAFGCGDKHPFAVLTDAQVVEIRQAALNGASRKSLSEQYQVTINVISRICIGRTRRHLLADGLPPPDRPRISKLTVEDVADIKRELAAGAKQVDIAKRYRVHYSTISCIYRGSTWKF